MNQGSQLRGLLYFQPQKSNAVEWACQVAVKALPLLPTRNRGQKVKQIYENAFNSTARDAADISGTTGWKPGCPGGASWRSDQKASSKPGGDETATCELNSCWPWGIPRRTPMTRCTQRKTFGHQGCITIPVLEPFKFFQTNFKGQQPSNRPIQRSAASKKLHDPYSRSCVYGI